MDNLSVLIIDDEESILISLKSYLSKRNYKLFTAKDGKEGFEIIKNNLVDVVLTDFRMPEWDGKKVLQEIKNLNPEIEVVMITAFGNVEDAVEIMKLGAYDYLSKPIDLDELDHILKRIKEKKLLIAENKILKDELTNKHKFDSIISSSKEMEEVLNTAGRISKSKATVLIRGESGTGKELIAKAVHFNSDRNTKTFVTVNVAALSESLLESELFGHIKGSFTGAISDRKGKFEEADGGTIFIDEVGDIPLNVQVKLLRVIQFGEIQKVGSNEIKKVDVRIIAATHRNLEEMIKNNIFREDLFYRLNVISLVLPPLRKRKSDIPTLLEFFMKKFNEKNSLAIVGIEREALDKLLKYNFPGNVRELENIVERAMLLCRSNIIDVADLPPELDSKITSKLLDPYNFDNSYEEKVKAFEKEMIEEVLNETQGNKSAAARILGITERHLRSRIERVF